MTKTLIDVDEELLAGARRLLGTATTKKDAVNQALRELVRTNAIRAYLQATSGSNAEAAGLALVDASAMMHCASPAVAARLVPLLVLDDLATCAAVKHELAVTADDPVLAALRQVPLRWLPTDDADLGRASEIQAQLTKQGERQLPWSRLVAGAVALRHAATVLHYSADFDLIAKVTGQAVEWVLPPETLAGRS